MCLWKKEIKSEWFLLQGICSTTFSRWIWWFWRSWASRGSSRRSLWRWTVCSWHWTANVWRSWTSRRSPWSWGHHGHGGMSDQKAMREAMKLAQNKGKYTYLIFLFQTTWNEIFQISTRLIQQFWTMLPPSYKLDLEATCRENICKVELHLFMNFLGVEKKLTYPFLWKSSVR